MVTQTPREVPLGAHSWAEDFPASHGAPHHPPQPQRRCHAAADFRRLTGDRAGGRDATPGPDGRPTPPSPSRACLIYRPHRTGRRSPSLKQGASWASPGPRLTAQQRPGTSPRSEPVSTDSWCQQRRSVSCSDCPRRTLARPPDGARQITSWQVDPRPSSPTPLHCGGELIGVHRGLHMAVHVGRHPDAGVPQQRRNHREWHVAPQESGRQTVPE